MTRRPVSLLFLLCSLQPLVAPLVTAQQLGAPAAGPHSPAIQAPQENQFGVSQTMFVTMAAINAGGYDAGLDSPLNERFRVRKQVREELGKRTIPSLNELRAFYQQHKKPSESADLGQYISFALIVGDAPAFELPSGKLPPDVEDLRELSPLLASLYKEANLEELWKRSAPAYRTAINDYQDQVISTLFEANGYTRNPSGYLGRRFQIFLDLLGAPNQIQVRSYRDDYYVVITPTTAPVVEEVRDAYLAYLLDPLSFKYSTTIKEKKQLAKYAQDAPALDLAYKDDFSLLLTKSLIKAIDSRLMHASADQRAGFVNEAMREGYILTGAFANLLPTYEKQQEALRIYYPDLVAAIDVRKEEKRLKQVEFVQSAPSRVVAGPSELQLPPAEATLQAAEGLYEQQQYSAAAKLFKQVFEQTTDKVMHGRAYYGLARIAVHENNKDQAVELFQRTAEANPDPAITAWAHVYLGRLAQAKGDPGTANDQFKLALATNGASQMARDAAENGLKTNAGDKHE